MRTVYEDFCRTAYLPLQLQPWWLDAAAGPENWSVALTADKGGRITGVLPYCLQRRYGLQLIGLPPFTAYGGPWYSYPENTDWKRSSKYTFEKRIATELIAQLPPTALFRQHFHPSITNWMPFHWAGFRQTTRYTYIIQPNTDVRAGMASDIRKKIDQASREYYVQVEDAPDVLFDLAMRSMQYRGLKTGPQLRTVFERLHQALRERNCCAIAVARSRADGKPAAAQYICRDEYRAALLLSGLARGENTGHVNYLLLDYACSLGMEGGRSLDFEGSMDEGVERVFRAFGGELTAYSAVWKTANRLIDWAYRR